MNHNALPLVCALSVVALAPNWTYARGVPARRQGAAIDDMTVIECDFLLSCPDVAKTQLRLRAASPTRRIIHIVDAHYARLDDFAQIARAEARKRRVEITDGEISCWHRWYVEALVPFRTSQTKLLCWLVDRQGLDHVFREAEFPATMADFRKSVEDYREYGVPRETFATEMRSLSSQIEQCAVDPTHLSALRARRKHVEILLWNSMLLGATGDLLIARPFVTVLPAEEKGPYNRAREEIDAGIHGLNYKAREAVIVRKLLAHRRCSVIVLGAAHDLSDEIGAQSGGRCEYIRVTPRGFPPPALEPLIRKAHGPQSAPTRFSSGMPAAVLLTLGSAIAGAALWRWRAARRHPRPAGASNGL